MAEVLAATGKRVIATDLYDRGYGEAGFDSLKSTRKAPNVVTNPPCNAAEGLLATGLQIVEKKFALLLRPALLEGANHAKTIVHRTPPRCVCVFSARVTFYPKGVIASGSGTTTYALYVWDKALKGQLN